MFSLIISIIAIALVIVLAGASLYYGGDAFNQGTAKGEFAKIVNEAQQVSAGFTLAKVDQVVVTDVTSLVAAKYLAVAPSTTFVVTAADPTATPAVVGVLTASGLTTDVCAAFYKPDGTTQQNPLASCTGGTATYNL